MCQGLPGDVGRPSPDAIDARERLECTLCLTYYYREGERERHVPVDGTHAKKQLHFESLTSKSAVAKSKSASEMCAGQSAPQSPTG